MSKNKKSLTKMILIALFSALAYTATLINIPLPTGGMIHLGNFVCILAGLLCGGLIGGVSGSLGMGLYDLHFYSAYPETIIRTFIVKFLLGFVVGVTYRYILKKKINVSRLIIIISILFFSIFLASTFIYFINDGIINIGDKKLEISLSVLIVSALFTILLVAQILFQSKLKSIERVAFFATTVGILVNIIGEFTLRIVLSMLITKLPFQGALVNAVVKLPSVFLTGIVTAVLITLVYYPIYIATKDMILDKKQS